MATATVDIGTLIVSTPGTCGGKPRIASNRIRVSDVVYVWRDGATAEEIAERFEGISLGEVHAALAYYFVNSDAIDRQMLEDELFGAEHEAEGLRHGGGPPSLTAEQRSAMVKDLEHTAAVLRQRLG